MTLDQLRVDSYATQVSENELTEVKGGSTPACYWGIAAIAAVASIVVVAIEAANDHAECGTVTTTTTDGCGNTTTTTRHDCRE